MWPPKWKKMARAMNLKKDPLLSLGDVDDCATNKNKNDKDKETLVLTEEM